MNELVSLITQRTGLSADMAQEVLKVVDGYLKSKLPEPVASQISTALTSSTGSSSQVAGQAQNIAGDVMGNHADDQLTQH